MKSAETRPRGAGPTQSHPERSPADRERPFFAETDTRTPRLQRKPAFDSNADEPTPDVAQLKPLTDPHSTATVAPGHADQAGPSELFFAPRGREGFFARAQGAPASPCTLQTRLTIGAPDDAYEREADEVADRVVERTRGVGDAASPPVGDEDGALRRKPLAEGITPLQRNAAGVSNPGPAFEQRLGGTRGRGQPLSGDDRERMESGFGADFGGVRVHADSEAAALSRDIGAQAFTSGTDIYFNAGRYRPGSREGDHLLAHELTHTLQQDDAARGRHIARTEDEDTGGSTTSSTRFTVSSGDYAGTELDIANPGAKVLTIKGQALNLPSVKGRNASLFSTPGNFDAGGRPESDRKLRVRNTGQRGETAQVDNWKSGVSAWIDARLPAKLQEAREAPSVSPDGQVYYFALSQGNQQARVFGNQQQLKDRLSIPFFDQDGSLRSLQVDHVVERQIYGADVFTNYELLEASANASSGSSLSAEINRKITGARTALVGEFGAELVPPDQPAFRRKIASAIGIRARYEVNFAEEPTYDLPTGGHPDSHWGQDDMEGQGQGPLALLRPLNAAELEALNDPSRKTVLLGPAGGASRDLPEPDQLGNGFRLLGDDVGRVLVKGYDWDAGTLSVEAFKADGTTNLLQNSEPALTWRLDPIPGLNAKALDRGSVASSIRNSLRLPGLSPIRMDSLELAPGLGLLGRGKLLPTVPVVREADIDVVLNGQDLRIEKTFDLGELNVPSPLQVTESSIRVFAGTEGLGAEGSLGLAVERVGHGEVTASISTGGGFELEGNFSFDTDLFSSAEVEATYRDSAWGFSGTLGIDEGKIQGVDSAEITVGYQDETLSANGTATLDVPGVESGSLDMELGAAGFTLGGEFQLSSDIPGIERGSVNATLSRSAETGEWGIAAGGSAVPSIPGIDSELSIEYDNGIVTIGASAAYERGLLSGRVEFGATNRAVDAQGQPTGEAADRFRVYGGGELTIRLTPWLAATAGVRFLDNGEMEVQGRLGLPDTVDVFARREFRRNLFTAPTIEIPIFAIPLGPRSIGIVAQIGGGLDFRAGFGPGQLRTLEAEITYNPDHEDQTVVRGSGRFVVPADAGLILQARLGVGASVAIASITGGIELAGTLGLEAEAGAGVDITWSPGSGITLDAEADVSVQPKFRFDINAFVRGSLNLLFLELSETWRTNLVGFEWGPGITFGLRFPIHYVEGEPFNISFDDLEVTYPDLDIVDMAGDLARDVKDRIF